jgi:hypothetical protein
MRTFEEISATIATITGIPVNDDQTFIINGNIIPTASVKDTYDSYIQQLPTVESIDAFLPSHQMAIAQLALASCNTLVETNLGYFGANNFLQAVPMPVAQDAFGPPPAATYYVPAQPTGAPSVAQDANRNLIVDTLLTAAINVDQADSSKNLTSQPDAAEVSGLLGSGATQDLDPAIIVALPSEDDYESLISEMLGCKLPQLPAAQECTPINTAARTKQIVKAVCAAAVGSAAMLVQ